MMSKNNLNKVIYKLTVEDIQTVANDILNRDLGKNEIEKVTESLCGIINWYDNIYNAILMTNEVEK